MAHILRARKRFEKQKRNESRESEKRERGERRVKRNLIRK